MTTPRPAAILLIAATTALSQTAEIGQVPRVHVPAPAHWYEHLEGPFYMPSVPHADLKNSPRIYDLIRAGVLYLSLSDAIALAIENNLDVEIERYSQPIADLDVIRAKGGGALRGIDYSVIEMPPGIGGPATPLLNTPATGSVGSSSVLTNLAESTAAIPVPENTSILSGGFAAGPPIPTFDPSLTGSVEYQHFHTPEVTSLASGSSALVGHNLMWNLGLQQGFSWGTQIGATFNTASQQSNSTNSFLNPYTNSSLGINVTQPLLRGFGPAVNRRFIRIAYNQRKTSDLVFNQQIIATVTGIIRLYWDLSSLIQDVDVKRQTLALAEQLYANNRVSVEQGTLAPVEQVRAQAQVAAARQDLVNSEAFVRQEELIVKNVLTRRSTADPAIRDARIIPTDVIDIPGQEEIGPVEDMVAEALRSRPELQSARLQLASSNIYLEGSRNAVLPQLDLVASVTGSGLAGQMNPTATTATMQSGADQYSMGGLGEGISQIFRNRNPTYTIGVQVNLPLRNRIAQSDLARDEIQVRQTELRYQQLQNQVRLEVEAALVDLQRARAALDAAHETRTLQEKSLELEMERFQTGLSTTFLVLQYQGFVAQARSTEVAARGVYIKARSELERALGRTLAAHNISIDQAYQGHIQR